MNKQNSKGDLRSTFINLISYRRRSSTQIHPSLNRSKSRNRESQDSVSEYDIYGDQPPNYNYKLNSNVNQIDDDDSDSNSDDESTSDVNSKAGSVNSDDTFEYKKKQNQLDLKRFTDKIKNSFTNENIKRVLRWLLEYAYLEIHIAAGVITAITYQYLNLKYDV